MKKRQSDSSRDDEDLIKAQRNSCILSRQIENYAICSFCGNVFDNLDALIEHINEHTAKKPFQCGFPGCKRAFRKVKSLAPHFQHCHKPKLKDTAAVDNKAKSVQATTCSTKNDAAEEIKRKDFPSFLFTRDLPWPVQIEANADVIAEIRAFPPRTSTRMRDISEPLMGTFSSSLWPGNDFDN